MSDNPFVWDGSDLGCIVDEQVIGITTTSTNTYWRLKIEDHTAICIVRTSRTTHPAIIDELKEVFHLPKLGTHRVTYHNKLYLLIKAPLTPNETAAQEELTLLQVSIDDPKFRSQIQDILMFREALGISKTYERSIIIRNSLDPLPMSFYEPLMTFTEKRMIPTNLIQKWFTCPDLAINIRRWLKVTNTQQVPALIHKLRSQIEDVINRVDRTHIGYVSLIINRITYYLMFGNVWE